MYITQYQFVLKSHSNFVSDYQNFMTLKIVYLFKQHMYLFIYINIILVQYLMQNLIENSTNFTHFVADQLVEQKAQLQESSLANFEKNYPKNIFIPILEFLEELELQDHQEFIEDYKQKIEKKNVTSLVSIHKVVSQPWFVQNVDLYKLETYLCNKIFLNPKIKKKLFHLKLSRVVLQLIGTEQKYFRRQIYNKAHQISAALSIQKQQDEVFKYSSSLIYLLLQFQNQLMCFDPNLSKLVEQKSHVQNHDSNTDKHSKKNQVSVFDKVRNDSPQMKRQYNNLIKNIVMLLQDINANSSQLLMLEIQFKKFLQFRSYEISKKYLLNEGVPKWDLFYQYVLKTCLNDKINGRKITASILKQRINTYKSQSQSIKGLFDKKYKYVFTPIIIQPPPSSSN